MSLLLLIHYRFKVPPISNYDALLLTPGLALGLMKQGAMLTVLGTLITALAWPATLIAATDFIDSKWTIALNR